MTTGEHTAVYGDKAQQRADLLRALTRRRARRRSRAVVRHL